MPDRYVAQVRLLLSVLPDIAAAIKVLRPMKFGAGASGSVTGPRTRSASGHSP